MYRQKIIAATLATGMSVALSSTASAATYEVRVINLTSGLHFTPLIAATHAPSAQIFSAGSAASPELQAMAEGGNIEPLAALLESIGATSASSEGLLAPGGTTTMVINDGAGSVLSLAGMLLPTNDGFVGLNSVSLPGAGESVTYDAIGYDAGTEANDELVGSGAPGEAGFPAPPPVVASGTGTGGTGVPGRAEGFVHVHRNVVGDDNAEGGSSDINEYVHRWLNPVARITITAMGDDGNGVSAVTGISAIAYSSSALEVFWDAATSSSSFVTGYEIRRNGTVVDTRDGISFFDEGLEAGAEFTYEVRAMDAAGNFGEPASVTLRTNAE